MTMLKRAFDVLIPHISFVLCCLFLVFVHYGYGEIKSYEKDYPPIVKAAASGDLRTVQSLISNGANPNAPVNDGTCALHYVCRNGDDTHSLDIMKLLIDAGAIVRLRDSHGYEPILYVSAIDNLNVRDAFIENLVMNGGDLNVESSLIESGASQIVKTGQKSMRKFTLLEIVVNNFDAYGVIDMLHVWGQLLDKAVIERARAYAMNIGYRDIAQSIVEYQVLKVRPSIKSLTPLMVAVIRGDEKAVSDHKSGVNAISKDRFAQTALHLAIRGKKFEMVKSLVANGARVDVKDYLGNTPLHAVVRTGDRVFQQECIPLLVEAGAKLKDRNNNGNTVLMQAIRLRDTECISYLLATYPQDLAISSLNKDGINAVDLAKKLGLNDVVVNVRKIRAG